MAIPPENILVRTRSVSEDPQDPVTESNELPPAAAPLGVSESTSSITPAVPAFELYPTHSNIYPSPSTIEAPRPYRSMLATQAQNRSLAAIQEEFAPRSALSATNAGEVEIRGMLTRAAAEPSAALPSELYPSAALASAPPSDAVPSAPPGDPRALWLIDPRPIENPFNPSSYLNGTVEAIIPPTRQASHFSKLRMFTTARTPIETLFSEVKHQFSKPNTLNPSLTTEPASSISILARAIVDQATQGSLLEKSTSVLERLHTILESMDQSIARLHLKQISPEQRALIEVALRRACTEQLHDRIKDELLSSQFHPQTIATLENLHNFLTRNDAFKPVIDVKTLVAAPIVSRFTSIIQELSVTEGIHAPAACWVQIAHFTEHLQELFSVCEDPRKKLVIDKIMQLSLEAALPSLESGIVVKAKINVSTPGSLHLFARELASLKQMELHPKTASVSMVKAITMYFAGLAPDQATVDKKLEIFHILLSYIPNSGLKAIVAMELLSILHETEIDRYRDAATRNALPSTWVEELSQIADCLTRNGIYAEDGQQPLQLADIIPFQRASINNIDLVGGPLLDCLYQKTLAEVEASISSRSQALSRELSLQDKVPLYLEKIQKVARSVADSTDAANQMFGNVFITRLLHKKFAEELTSAALNKADAQREEFFKTGYLPIEVYGDAIALHNLETNNGQFPSVGQNALQRQIKSLFGTSQEIIWGRDSTLERQAYGHNSPAPISVAKAQVQTFNWALAMSEEGRSEFLPPPFFVPAPRAAVVEAPIEEPVAVSQAPVMEAPAPIVAASSAVETPVRPERVEVRATDTVRINERDPRWFDNLPTEMQLCILSNILMKQIGPVEQSTLAYLPEEEKRDYAATALINNARRDYDPLTIARNRLMRIETELPADSDFRVLAKRALTRHALEHHTFTSDVTLRFLRDRGFGDNQAFLKAVYEQAVAEMQGFEVSQGNFNWAGEHWYADTQQGQYLDKVNATRRVAQALERVILCL